MDLKPCPFCGGADLQLLTRDLADGTIYAWFRNCNQCGCQAPSADTKEGADFNWNTRTDWISVKTPPDEWGEYLCALEDGQVKSLFWSGRDIYNPRWWCHGFPYPDVTHWQPLPEPPEARP